MATRKERIDAAKKRLYSRYPDRDEIEAKLMSRFKGLTQEELKANYIKASEERIIKCKKEKIC